MAPRRNGRKSKEERLKGVVGELRELVIGLLDINLGLHETIQGLEGDLRASREHILTLSAQINELRANVGKPYRTRLPDTRQAITHKFDIAGHEGYLTVGLFEDGTPGELFITMAKEGSTVGGLMDTIGTLVSLAFQYGVPMEILVKKFAHQRFEPSGFTKNPEIPIAKSVTDYMFRWLACEFIPGYKAANSPNAGQTELPLKDVVDESKPAVFSASAPVTSTGPAALSGVPLLNSTVAHFMTDAPTCDTCGALTVRNGACYKCLNCGNSMGCS